MDKLFSDFPKVSKLEWEEKLTKELKGADFNSSLRRNDEIEELEYATYAHTSDQTLNFEIPGEAPFLRGNKSVNNDWNIASLVVVEDEKEANKKALDLLMSGTTTLVFQFKKEVNNLSILFHQIGFEFIQTQFVVSSFKQFEELVAYFQGNENCDILYRIDFHLDNQFSAEFSKFASLSKGLNTRFCFVDGFSIQQTGATIIQELAIALSNGNEYLIQLINEGYSVDEAASSIHFSIGVGSNYFYEISKVRAFRKLWNSIVEAYKPTIHSVSKAIITAEIGWINKSLNDPYTNLLRQTTEVMSVISAGVESVLVHPYDSKSVNGISGLSARMATNISLILKDESYFDKVIDPIGGSYSIEQLTEQIAQKVWIKFQEIDSEGGILNEKVRQTIVNEISEKAQLKLEKIKSGKQMLIGVNKYPNPQTETNDWLTEEYFFGLKKLIFERDIQ